MATISRARNTTNTGMANITGSWISVNDTAPLPSWSPAAVWQHLKITQDGGLCPAQCLLERGQSGIGQWVGVHAERPVPAVGRPAVLRLRSPPQLPVGIRARPAGPHAAGAFSGAGLNGAVRLVDVDMHAHVKFHPQRQGRDVGAEPFGSLGEVSLPLPLLLGPLVRLGD